MEISSSDDDNGDDINSPNEEGEDNEQDADASPRRRTVNITTPPPTTTPRAPQPQKRHYSGLARAAATIVHAHDRDELFADDVAWQRSIHNDAALIKRFRSEVLQHSGLVVFAFMRSGSPYIHLLHSPTTYFTHKRDDDLNGKDIAFVGDRTLLQPTPTPVILSPQTPWNWVTKAFTLDSLTLENYYASPNNQKSLWVPPTPAKNAATTALPKLLLLPTLFVAYCASRPRTPWELHQGVTKYITTTAVGLSTNDCKLVLDWCVGASHAEKGNVSWLSYAIDAAIPNSASFHHWMHRRLNTMLGDLPQATTGPPPQPNPPPQTTRPQEDWIMMAKHMRDGIIEGLRQPPTGKREEEDDDKQATNEGKKYDEQQVLMLQGFSHAEGVEDLQPIWAAFQETKNQDAHRLELGTYMQEWAQKRNVSIIRNMEFSDKVMTAIVSMKFNPPGCTGAAYFSSLHKGLTILTCRPPEGEEVEALRDRELHERLTEGTRTLSELIAVPPVKGTITPAEDYHEFKITLGTFCALLWSLFGPKCDYYRKCYSLWTVLDDNAVYAKRRYFSPLLCRQMTWAIIEDGRRYFSKILTKRHFMVVEDGDEIKFPKSMLDDVASSAHFQTPVIRPSFPAEWQVGKLTSKQKSDATTVTNTPQPQQSTIPTSTSPSQLQIPTTINRTPSVVSGLTSTNTRPRRQHKITGVRETDINPQIKALMKGHLMKNAFVMLRQVLDHLGMTIDELPKLPAYVKEGKNTLCYNYILGHCTSKFCAFQAGHAPATALTEDFVRNLCQKLEGPVQAFNQPAAAAARAAARKDRE